MDTHTRIHTHTHHPSITYSLAVLLVLVLLRLLHPEELFTIVLETQEVHAPSGALRHKLHVRVTREYDVVLQIKERLAPITDPRVL